MLTLVMWFFYLFILWFARHNPITGIQLCIHNFAIIPDW
jgi:hypothetical protein